MTMQDCLKLNASRSNCSSGTIQLNSSGLDRDANPEESSPVPSLGGAFQMQLRTIPVEAAIFVILTLAVLVNGFVLTAMFKVSAKTLQAKFLLASNLIANVSFSLSSKLPTGISWICKAYGLNDPIAFACFELITWLVPSLALFTQGFSTLSLACDRVYAVCFPLTYKTKGYSMPVKFIIIFIQLSLAVGLLLPAVILPLRLERSRSDICTTLLPGYYLYVSKIRAIYLLITTVVTFAFYTFIFFNLKCTTHVKEAERHGAVSRKSISLTVVYFLVHLTTVLLSAPLSLYSVYLGAVLKVSPNGDNRMVLQLLLMLLLFNSIVDPIFLTWKIPAVRKKLPYRLNMCVSRKHLTSNNPSSSTRKSDIEKSRTES